ncbi:MAG: hypothetical protein L6Q37_01175 [Bdellovibrionaceae bacterium]|nr:hypothetical protein [Pseudobdellovibrionaceae bacterium]NUM59261.1 hypothetical protein [Pseudobdellovibrionaceae bacterium]
MKEKKLLIALLFFQFFVAVANAASSKSNCTTSLSSIVSGELKSETGQTLKKAPLTDGALVVDTNFFVAREKISQKRAQANDIRIVTRIKALLQSGKVKSLFATKDTVKESTRGNSTIIPDGVRVTRTSLSRETPEYQDMVNEKLLKMEVGELKFNSEMDRKIVADVLFAQTENNVVPKFATGDYGIIMPLCKMSLRCRFSKTKDEVLKNFSQGFEVQLTDLSGVVRKMVVLPL